MTNIIDFESARQERDDSKHRSTERDLSRLEGRTTEILLGDLQREVTMKKRAEVIPREIVKEIVSRTIEYLSQNGRIVERNTPDLAVPDDTEGDK